MASSRAPASPRFEIDPSGLGHIVFDDPGRRLNVFSRGVLESFAAVLDRVESDVASGTVRAVLIRSGKAESFIAGADVSEIGRIESAAAGAEAARAGQSLFQRIADLGVPTTAAVHGLCLGGGTELALACNRRVASDHPSTRMGLPEVQLGILPAWGGTTRLPRLVGLRAALDLILTGKPASSSKARRIGLVDAVLPHQQFLQRAVEVALPGARGPSGAGSGGLVAWLLDGTSPGRSLVLRMARKRVLEETGGHYPAPLKILRVLQAGSTASVQAGLDLEARALGELVVSPVCRNLLHIFALRERGRKGPWTEAGRARPVARIGVLGAGVMGGGIAQLAAYEEVPVRLKDIRHEAIGSGLAHARKLFDRAVDRRKLTRREADARMDLISGGLDYAGFSSVDLVVEAVVERMDVKKSVFAETEEQVRADTVLTSNTSSLSIDEMAEALQDPRRFAGMHFFNPVHRMPLVEVVRGAATSDDTVETVASFVAGLGKIPVVTRDGPGFLVNRILGPYLNEAGHLLDEGYDGRTIDGIWTSWGMPMGPYRLIDEVGIDVMSHAGAALHAALGERLRPSRALEAVTASGRLGKKGGSGFYEYRRGRAVGFDDSVYDAMGLSPSRTQPEAEMVVERLLYTMINEAARILEEEIVSSAGDVDLGMIMGTGFPPFRGGLLRHADEDGSRSVVETLDSLASIYGPRFEPCPALRRMAAGGDGFYDAYPTPDG